MSDSKAMIRYLGYRAIHDGGRDFDFSYAYGAAKPVMITIAASSVFFKGADRIALQEAAGICYETLKCRLQAAPATTPDRFDLTAVDVAEHRKIAKGPAGRR
jgi:hypothetical protein